MSSADFETANSCGVADLDDVACILFDLLSASFLTAVSSTADWVNT